MTGAYIGTHMLRGKLNLTAKALSFSFSHFSSIISINVRLHAFVMLHCSLIGILVFLFNYFQSTFLYDIKERL